MIEKSVKVKVDSGAGVSVAPKGTFRDYKIFPTYESTQGIMYTSASGHKIADEGIRYPIVKTSTGQMRALSMRVADVNSPLISVYDMINKDQRVVFDTEGSYVEHKHTGQRIKIDWHGHNPVMEFRVLEPVDEDLHVPMLADVDTDNGDPEESRTTSSTSSAARDPSGSSGVPSQQSFLRQARLP